MNKTPRQHPPTAHRMILAILDDLQQQGHIEERDRETFGRIIEGHVLFYLDELNTIHEQQVNDLRNFIDFQEVA